MSRLELTFADNPGTTGHHLSRAVEKLAERSVVPDMGEAPRLWVESFGHRLLLPTADQVIGRGSAAWMIDSHLNIGWQRRVAPAFRHVFCAQQPAVDQFRSEGVSASWLPLAAPTDLLDKGPPIRDRRFDLAFVGRAPDGSHRAAVLEALRSHFSFVPTPDGFIQPAMMMAIYRQAKLVINLPIRFDLNMRAFEAAAAGSGLATSPCASLEDIFPSDTAVIVPDQSPQRWIDAISSALVDPNAQRRADAMFNAVRDGHTYEHRVVEICCVLAQLPQSQVPDRARLEALVTGLVHYGQPLKVARAPGLTPPARVSALVAAAGVGLARRTLSSSARPFPQLSSALQRFRMGE